MTYSLPRPGTIVYGYRLDCIKNQCQEKFGFLHSDRDRVLTIDPRHESLLPDSGDVHATTPVMVTMPDWQPVPQYVLNLAARPGGVCGRGNPDYPGEYVCTYPHGHDRVEVLDPAETDPERGEFMDHGAPESGAWWNL